MAQSGFTPIQLFRTTTAAAVPTAGSLADGELAINLTDEKLYFKNASGVVKLLASAGGAAGTVTSVDVSGGTTGLTFSGGPITSSGTITMAGTLGVANGGTGASSLTSGYLLKGNGTSAVSSSVIYDDGTNVGIGTAAPGYKLDVAGQSRAYNTPSSFAQLQSLTQYTGSAAPVGLGQGSDATGYLINLANAGMAFGTNNSERMRITSAGDVGIGTSSPGDLLHVNGNIRIGAATGANYIYSASTTFLAIQTGINAPLLFLSNNGSTETMRITSAGNVGIGTSSPGAKLHVAGGGNIRLTATSDGSNGVFQVYDSASSTLFQLYNDSTKANLAVVEAKPMVFYTTNTERMRIDASGNVGIGTSSPSSYGKFAVVGTLGAVYVDAGANLLGFTRAGTNYLYSPSGPLAYSATQHIFLNQTQSTEWARIDTNGRLGIGNNTPTYPLDVYSAANGVIRVGGGSGTNQGAAYFVKNANNSNTQAAFGDRARIFGGTPDQLVSIFTSASPLTFDVNGSERARFDTSGNLGVGTSTMLGKVTISDGTYPIAIDSGTYSEIQSYSRPLLINRQGNNVIIGGTTGLTALTVNGGDISLGVGNKVRFYNSGNTNWSQIYNPTGGQMAFDSGAGEAMRIDGSSNVGIGTSSPNAKLHVQLPSSGTGVVFRYIGGTNNPGLFISTNETTRVSDINASASTSGILTLSTDGAERLRIDGSGLVGVNASSFVGRFNVSMGSATGAGVVSAWDSTYALFGGVTANAAAVGIGFNTSAGGLLVSLAPNSAWQTMNYHAANHVWFASGGEAMRVNTDSNVGIGTTAPASRLHVGSGYITAGSSSSTSGSKILAGEYSNAEHITTFGSDYSSGGPVLGYGVWPSTSASGAFVSSAAVNISRSAYLISGQTHIWYNGAAQNIAVGSAVTVTERMRIDASGNLLVGTTSATAGYLMSVNGALTLANGYSLSWGAYNSGGPTIAGSTNFLAFYPNGASSGEKMRISSTGIVGIGVVPSANDFTGTLQTGWVGHGITPRTSTNLVFNMNANHSSGDWRYGNSGAAALYIQSDAGHAWYNAPSGTAGNVISFNEAMRITSAGNVGIGTSNPLGKLSVVGQGTTQVGFNAGTTGSPERGNIWYDTDNSGWKLNIGKLVGGTFTAQMTFQDNGNVGVGTTSPSGKLTIQNANAYDELTFAGTEYTNIYSYTTSGMDVGIISSSSAFLRLLTNSTEQVRIDSSGNVGIGTSSPSAKLHVQLPASGTGVVFRYIGGTNNPGLFISTNETTRVSDINASASTSGILTLSTSGSERLRIDDSGNVGIGTSSPGAKLEIYGGSIKFGNASGNALLTADGSATYIGSLSNHPLVLNVNNTERMRIDASGNVGIGTSSSYAVLSDRTLFVAGSSYASLNLVCGGAYGGAGMTVDSSTNLQIRNAGAARLTINSSGGITSSDLADAVGYKGLPQNSRTTGYTLALSDMGKHISITTGNITIPANGSVAFPVGAAVTIYNNSGSTQTISITTDTLRQAGTTNTGTRTLAAYGVATVLKVASTTWVISGNVS